MALITVEGIRVFAYHGHLPEEEILGGHFIINVWVNVDTLAVEQTDDLNDTVDYVLINKIVTEEMAIRSKLLEQVGQRILDRVFEESALVKYADVAVSKLNPPIGGNVEKVTILLSKWNRHYS